MIRRTHFSRRLGLLIRFAERRIVSYSHHSWPQQTVLEEVALLEHFEDLAFPVVGRVDSSHRFVNVRVEIFAERINLTKPRLLQSLMKLPIYDFDALPDLLLRAAARRLERALEVIKHRQNLQDQLRGRIGHELRLLALDPLSIIIELGLFSAEQILNLFQLGPERFGFAWLAVPGEGDAGFFLRLGRNRL